MEPLGIISGTVFLQKERNFADLREETLETEFGPAVVFRSAEVALIPRHGKDPCRHVLPHLINHQANLKALKDLGVREVLGIHSTGSLKRRLTPGTLVVPDDYLMPTPGPTTVRKKAVHITPALNMEARRRWILTARDCAIDIIDGGIYWQTVGPRLETRAEVRMMAQFADLVGMTMASEAIVAQELGLPFASLCSVDNYAHGLEGQGLAMEEIRRHAQQSSDALFRILTRYLKRGPLPGTPV